MTAYVHPAYPCPTKFGLQMTGNVMINQSPLNKATQTVEFPGDLWVVRAEFPPIPHEDLGPVEAFWNRFRGIAHTLKIWHMLRPEPVGTVRGVPSLFANYPEGANTIRFYVGPGETIIPGDMLGVPLSTGFVQLVQVVDVAFLGTTIEVDITPPLRRNALVGAILQWDHPLVECLVTSSPFITGVPVVSEGFTIEAIEVPR